MPKFLFCGPDGIVRSRSTRVRDPGWTHAVFRFYEFSGPQFVQGWQLDNTFVRERFAEEYIKEMSTKVPGTKFEIMPRLGEPEMTTKWDRLTALENRVDALEAMMRQHIENEYKSTEIVDEGDHTFDDGAGE